MTVHLRTLNNCFRDINIHSHRKIWDWFSYGASYITSSTGSVDVVEKKHTQFFPKTLNIFMISDIPFCFNGLEGSVNDVPMYNIQIYIYINIIYDVKHNMHNYL